jgi:hypothetical protein
METAMARWSIPTRALLVIVAVSLLARGASAIGGTPPAGLTGFALDGRAELAWQPVAGATGYDVYRGSSPTTIATLMTPGGVTGTSFLDTSAANATTYYYTVRSVVSGSESGDSQIAQVKPVARGCSTGNPIALENCYPGSTDWVLASTPTVAAGGIEGFATATSINRGESLGLRVNTAGGVSYDAEIYRSGYYGGSGARLVSAIRKNVGAAQPACTNAATTTGLYDCSNWSTSLTLTTTNSWPTGVYLVRLVRNDNGAENEILFVVRDDSRATPLLYGIPFSTYEAYNNYGGKSLYSFNSTGSNTVAGTPRAVKVSFDRPFEQARTAATTNFNDWYTRTDYELVSWLERSGYDVSYQAVTDLELSGQRVKNHRAYVLGAHDEYYSAAMRSALQQARDAGVSLFDTGANAIYWKIRFENGPNGGQNRIEVCYKSVESGVSDPSAISTTTWRDPAGPNNPENGLLGTMYIGDNASAFYPLKVSATEGSDRVYRYTGLDTGGASTTIGTSLVGWEWDARVATGFEPAGVKTLASSLVTGNLVQNNGGNNITGSATSNSARYTAPSGAIVFATGSNQWARGLARNAQGVGEPDVRIQQTATNVLEDMGVVPQTPAANIRLDDPADPTVSSTTPTDAQTNVPIGMTVSATFPSSMDGTTITTSSFALKRPDGTTVAAAVAYDGVTKTATLTPSAPLANGVTYTARLATTVKSTVGRALAYPYAWIFTTIPPPTTLRINAGGAAYTSSSGTAWVADTDFTGGGTNSTAHAITGTTDQTLYKAERWGAFSYTIPVTPGTYDVKLHFVEMYYISGNCSQKRVFSIDIADTPTNPDIANLDICGAVGAYAALVKTISAVQVTDGFLNVQSIYGSLDDPEIAAIEVIPSGTGAPPATPTVTSTSPANGATGVGVSASVTAAFSTAMDGTTVTTTSFTLKKPDGTTVPANVSYDASSLTATLTPSAALTSSTTYTSTLTTAVKSSSGTALANPYTWSFTTAAPGTPTAVRINAGGGAYTSSSGATFVPDTSFTGGSTNSTTAAITGTSDPALYKDERWGAFSYAIPVVNGTYDVRLHFVEMYYVSGGCIGKRIFSIDIADTPTNPDLQNLDVCSQAGGANTALVKTISGVSVTDGVVNISSIYGSADDPEIAAIEVVPSSGPPPPPPDPSQVGQWSAPVAWPLVAVHMSLLPTGNVVAWDGFAAAPNSQRIWNPSNGTFTPVPYGVNIFCSGHVLLANGRTLVVGGHQSADVGIPDTTIFDSSTNSWTAAPNMSVGRWYPTATELGDGRVLVFSGDNIVQDRPGATPPFSDASVNSLPEIYDPASNSWADFNNATLTSPLYPLMFLLGDGRVLDAGPDTTTRIFNPSTGSWSTIGTSPFDGMSAVMYLPGKIMKAGSWADPDFNGSQTYNATAKTAVLDMNQSPPAWRSTASMAFPRAYENLTLLPDGTVLASGGMTTSDGVDLSKAVLPAEIWDPTTETWRTVAALQNGREYHSTALLLPDGRVLMAGGGQLPGTPAVDQTNAEIYSPPYFFKGTRPTITSAPATVQYNSTFTVQTPDASSIQSVALIRTPSVTHAFDQNQRFQKLSFTQSSGSLTVAAPLTSNLAPPGYYMLFILNTNGVPSVARFVRFPAPSEDTQAPTAPTNLTASGSGDAASLTWMASTDNVGVTNYSVYRSTTSGFTPSLSNRIAQVAATSYTDSGLAAGTYYYVVKAQDAAGNLSNGSNEASASITSVGDTIPPTVSLTAPSAGSTVNGTVMVSANASDNVGVADVQFKLDGTNLGAVDTAAPYSVPWDTTQATNGSHTLTAVARDAAHNATTSSGVSVTVDNAAPPPPPGLVAAYSFDQGTGTTVPDASGSGNTGTLSNTSWSLSGKYGGALSFNGTSSLVSINDSSGLHLSGGMTLEAWVNASLLTNKKARTVLMKENAPGLQYALYANTDTNAPSGNIFTTQEFDTRDTATVSVNTWTFVAATYDGSSLSLYVNGRLVSTKPVIGSMSPSTGKLRIGGNTIRNEWFKGLIDEIRIYNRALSVAEIQADMNTRVGS